MSKPVPMPDMRFEQSFLTKLTANARKRQVETRGELTAQEAALPPPITASVILSTVFIDQMVMPLVQGFGFAAMKLTIFPWLRAVFGLGRRMGAGLRRS